jgi:hypothetical protein
MLRNSFLSSFGAQFVHAHSGDAAHGRFERRQMEARIECVRPELFSCDKIVHSLDEAYTADHSFVCVCETAIVGKIEVHACEGRFLVWFCDKMERACHTEMQGQPPPTVDIRLQVLAVSPRCNEFRAVQAIDERLRTELAQDDTLATPYVLEFIELVGLYQRSAKRIPRRGGDNDA